MTAINPGFASTTISGGGGSDLQRYIDDFFSGAWLPYSHVDVIDWILPQIVYGNIGDTDTTDRRDITKTHPEVPVGVEDFLPGVSDPGVQLPDLGIVERQPQIHSEIGGVWQSVGQGRWRIIWEGITYDGMTDSGAIQLSKEFGIEPPFMGFPDVTPSPEPDVPEPAPLLWPDGQPNTTGDDMTFHSDLFNDLGGIADDWLRGQLGLTGDATVSDGGGGGPTIVAQGAANCGAGGASPVYKKVCGQYRWVYPKRRRRRALLTESDYNALLRIEGLKVNKNMTVAVAKALTR